MRYLAEQSGRSEQLEFFNDAAYKNINHVILSTSTVFSPHIQMGGFAPVVPDGFGVGYMVMDDWVGCNASSYPGSPSGAQFVELVQQSIEDIKAVLELSLIHISEPTRRTPISYAVFCLKKKK